MSVRTCQYSIPFPLRKKLLKALGLRSKFASTSPYKKGRRSRRIERGETQVCLLDEGEITRRQVRIYQKNPKSSILSVASIHWKATICYEFRAHSWFSRKITVPDEPLFWTESVWFPIRYTTVKGNGAPLRCWFFLLWRYLEFNGKLLSKRSKLLL